MESSRTAIKDSLLAKATKYMTEAKGWTVFLDENSKVVKTAVNDGNITTHTELSVDGVMPEDYRRFLDNYFENIKQCVPSNLTLTKVEDDEGHTCVH